MLKLSSFAKKSICLYSFELWLIISDFRDPETKTKLDLQKHFFIEQKLVESIQRIEKGNYNMHKLT